MMTSKLCKTSLDYVSTILEEISLEGLDGITLKTLYLRLMLRNLFPLGIDENTVKHIWLVVKNLSEVEFFCLPNERDEFLLDGFKLDPENLNARLAVFEDECYPVSFGKDSEQWGSCFVLDQRVNITNEARNMSLEQVQQTWGSKFVIVTSFQRRLQFLSSDLSSRDTSEVFVNKFCYLFLEKIGRARDRGIFCSGPNSLYSIEKDSKRTFYLIGLLIKKGLVIKTMCDGKDRKSGVIGRMSLARFGSATKANTLFERVLNELKTVPDGVMTVSGLIDRFPEISNKKIRRSLTTMESAQKSICYKLIPAKDLRPDLVNTIPQSKGKGDKKVKCVQLVETIDETEELDDEEIDLTCSEKRDFFPDVPLVNQVYQIILESRSDGISMKEVFKKVATEWTMIRVIIKVLLKKEVIRHFTVQRQRALVKKFVLTEGELKQPVVQALLAKTPDIANDVEPSSSPIKMVADVEMKPQVDKMFDENTSSRRIFRMGIIIRVLKVNEVMSKSDIYKHVHEEEMKSGYSDKLDRRSLQRILKHLVDKGVLKLLSNRNKNDRNSYYSSITYEQDEYCRQEPSIPKPSDELAANPLRKLVMESDVEMSTFFDSKPCRKGGTSKYGGKRAPKFLRLSILHDLIFYLSRGYSGITDRASDDLLAALQADGVLEPEVLQEIPPLYSDRMSCYMFIPPLTPCHDRVPGWCTLMDLLINCPLSMFIKLVKLEALPAGLSKYLEHPVRTNYPLRSIPASLRTEIVSTNQVSQLLDEVRRLCYMGLCRIGHRSNMLRNRCLELIYVNTRASILDTTICPRRPIKIDPSLTYEVIPFHFQSILDVKQYWVRLFNVCLETELSCRRDEYCPVRIHEKEELKVTVVPCSLAQALELDTGELPGDQLGAGGLDSILFSFVRANWVGSSKQATKRKPRKQNPPKKILVPKAPQKRRVRPKRKIEVIAKKPKKPLNLDELDLQAIKEMKTLRVQWLQSEDNILLLCRAAVDYLCPNSRKSARISCTEIRTALRRYCPSAIDKTQRSIARRTLFLLKNEKKDSTVRCVVQVLVKCPEVKKRFDSSELVSKIKPTAPNLKELVEKLVARFHDLIDYMVTRFLDNGVILTTLESNLPDTIEELREQFNCEDPRPTRLTIRKIREDAIRCVLMSSLASVTDKCSIAAQLFEVYRQFDDHLLRTALRRLNHQKIVSIQKRPAYSLPSRTKYVPMSNAPYQFARVFCFLMNTKYQQCVYHDAYVELNRILCIPSGGEMELNLGSCGPAAFVLASLDLVSFTAATPEQFVILDTEMLPPEITSKIMKRYSKLMQDSGQLTSSADLDDIDQKGELDDDLEYEPSAKRPFIFNEPDDEVPKKLRMEERAEARVANVLKREHEETKNKAKRLCNPNLDDSEVWEKMEIDESIVDHNDGKGKDASLGFRSARLALFTLREVATKELEGISSSSKKNTVDLFVVNTSKIICSPKEALKRTYGVTDGRSARKLLLRVASRSDILRMSVDEEAVLSNVKQTLSPRSAEKLCAIYQYISTCGALGASLENLHKNFSYDDLPRHLRVLEDSTLVLRLGIEETRFVSHKNAGDWAVSSFKLTKLNRDKIKPSDLTLPVASTSKKMPDLSISAQISDLSTRVRLIMRPWIRIEGTVNRKVLDRYLGTILGHIMIYPGCTISSITGKFTPALSAVWVKEIIALLAEIGCIKYRILHVSKPTLFSAGVYTLSDECNTYEPDDRTILDPKVDAIIKLGQFIGNKSYNKDVLAL